MTPSFSNTLAELGRQFAAQLPARMDAINVQARHLEAAACPAAEAELLYRLVQSLSTSAAIFGMQPVADAARAVEARLAPLLRAGAAPSKAEWPAIGTALEHLNELAGVRSPETAAAPGSAAA